LSGWGTTGASGAFVVVETWGTRVWNDVIRRVDARELYMGDRGGNTSCGKWSWGTRGRWGTLGADGALEALGTPDALRAPGI